MGEGGGRVKGLRPREKAPLGHQALGTKAHPDKINSQYGPAARPWESLCRMRTTVSGIILPSYRAYLLSAPTGNKGPNSVPRDTNLASAPISSRSLLSNGFKPPSSCRAATGPLQPCLRDPLGIVVCVKASQAMSGSPQDRMKIQVDIASRPNEPVLLSVLLCRLGLSLLLVRLRIACRGIFGC